MPDISLSWPVALPRITQVFGGNAALYHRWGLRGHNGIDFGVAVGTPVLAADTGRVLWLRSDDAGFGLHLKLQHIWGNTLYAHLVAADAVEGQQVRRGQVIAYTGNSGISSGPHLHFGVQAGSRDNRYNGYIDPLPLLTPTPKPNPTLHNV